MKIKEWLLGITISIIFLMFCVFGTKLIYHSPKYEDYCDYSKINYPVLNKTNLSEKDLIEEQEFYSKYYKDCSDKYDLANKNYSKNMFITSLIFSIIVVILCVVFININSISGGLMFGSLMFIVYGTGKYWNYMDDLLRFVVLGVALIALIYTAYWINKQTDKRHSSKKNSGEK